MARITERVLGPSMAKKPPKKIDPDSAAWQRLANAEARNFCPQISPCRECGGPVVYGYCCNRCGSSTP